MSCEEYNGYSKYLSNYYVDMILYLMSTKPLDLCESLFKVEEKKEKQGVPLLVIMFTKPYH